MSSSHLTGRWGERTAARYLEERGCRLLARNLRTRHGEVDLIACQEGLLIFVEVKASASGGFVFPEYAVTPQKRARLLAVAEQYLQEHPEFNTWRLDVIVVEKQDGRPQIIHFENVFCG